jgi:F-type H+-transporting ATPase subunit epsilon
MSDPLKVEVVSPEEVVFSGEADMVITRTLGGGEIAFQSGHAAFLGALTECRTRIYLTDGTIQDIAVHGGFVEVSNNKVSVLSELAELAQDIDPERARRALARHEELLREERTEAAISGANRARARLVAAGENSFTA